MARMAFALASSRHSTPPAVVDQALASEPTCEPWAIELEAMGTGWHASSHQLSRGLDVDEDPPPEAIPPEWQWRWWIASFTAG